MKLTQGVNGDDLLDIDKIWKRHYSNSFGIPSLQYLITHGVVRENNRFLGYGMVKGLAEMIMILDKDASLREKVQTIKMLVEGMKETSGKFEQIHCFVDDLEFSDILIEHFGFIPISGKPLVLNVER